MYSCIIIDDDPLSSGVIAHYCHKNSDIHLIKQFSNPKEGLSFIAKNPVDLLFLDVEMPDMNGFELLDKLDYRPYVILFTSKSQYAYLAFEYNVVDFLKKPVNYTRFCEAIEKVAKHEAESKATHEASEQSSNDEIFIRNEGKLVKIPYMSIQFVEVMDDYVKVVTDQGNHLVLCTLKHMEEKLNGLFIKVHRSYVINIKKIENVADNKVNIQGKSIPVSKAHRSKLLSKLNIV
jgi:DNA-binding LytR/AlgR family response regulator